MACFFDNEPQTATAPAAGRAAASFCYQGPIELTVLNPDGTPAAGAGVGVFGATWHSQTGQNPPPRLKDHRTDARGRFALASVRECDAPTFFYAFDERRELAGFVSIEHLNDLAQPHTLRLQPARWVGGRIVSTESQKSGRKPGWAAAALSLERRSSRRLLYCPPLPASDQFRFLLPPGEYWLDLQGDRLEWNPDARISVRVPAISGSEGTGPAKSASEGGDGVSCAVAPHDWGTFDLPLSPLARLEGKSAPAWNVAGWNDGGTRIPAALRGRAVLLCFWHSSQPDSLKEIFDLHRRHGGERLTTLLIHAPLAGGLAEIQRALHRARDAGLLAPGVEPDLDRWPFPVAVDQPDPAAPALDMGLSQRPYGAQGYPFFILIDAEGKMAGSSAFQEPDFEKLLAALKER